MYAYLSVKNLSGYPIITVMVNNRLFLPDLISRSEYKPCPAGSIQVTVFNNRARLIKDLYLPLNSYCRYILEIYPDRYNLIHSGYS